MRQPGHRPHLQRRADDEQQPRLAHELRRPVDLARREELAEHDDVGLEDRAAGRARRRAELVHEPDDLRPRHADAVDKADGGADRAVYLDHVPRAGELVERVDVLRHERAQKPAPLELGEREVRRVGLGVRQHAQPEPVELPHLAWVALERVDRRVLHRVVLRPDPGRRAEVRDPALGRDPCPRQCDGRLPPGAAARAGRRSSVDTRRMDGYAHTLEVRVRFVETDAQGIAHNAAYLVWFEVGRVDYLARHAGGYRALRESGIEALVTESHVRYGAPARFDDVLRIHVRCVDVRAVPLRVPARAGRRAGRRRLDRARDRGLADVPADPDPRVARRGDQRG